MEASSSSYPSRTRRPSYTAPSVRSTTLPDRSASSLGSNSPQPSLLSQSHLSHRYQTGVSKRASPAPSSSTEASSVRARRPSHHTAMSMEDSPSAVEARPSLTAASNYLQEKLLRERKAEGERCASPSMVDFRGSQNSPGRPPYAINRPKSSTGLLDANGKKGVGLKEMEQTLTNLHKQNFDLKLELYHRRERQTTLEERCETLEAEKRDLQEINDKLLAELETRDKAVEEAVAMIVSLEANLEQLLHERQVAEIEAGKNHFFATDADLRKAISSVLNGSTGPYGASAASLEDTPRAKASAGKLTAHNDDSSLHTINRMPSFISDRSELTENLRNVYLGGRGASMVSLPRMSEVNSDVDFRDAANRIASPTLSVLSESSFMSVYGNKKQQQHQQHDEEYEKYEEHEQQRHEQHTDDNRDHFDDAPTIATTRAHERPMSPVACVPDIPLSRAASRAAGRRRSMTTETTRGPVARSAVRTIAGISTPTANDGGSSLNGISVSRTRPVKTAGTPTKKRSSSTTRTTGSAPANLHSLADFLGSANSPLQRLEKMEKSLQAMNEASRPGSQDDIAVGLAADDIATLTRHLRQQKKDALRRVRTDAPFGGGRDPLSNPHNLPPTPDTISTSTLRRFKNSSDTLCVSQDQSQGKETPEATSRSTSGTKRLSSLDSSIGRFPHQGPPSMTAFDSRLDIPGDNREGDKEMDRGRNPDRDGGSGSGSSSRAASFFETPRSIPRRPRSADETTLSHQRRSTVWGDSDNSSDDDMDLDGNDSASLHDYWLRESLRPTDGLAPRTSRKNSSSRSGARHGRVSPDLFGFPTTTTNGWATTAMFGSLGGQGFHGAAPLAQTLDALGASLPKPVGGYGGSSGGGGVLASPAPLYGASMQDGPPPPPNRRSSLHARTGSRHGTPSRSASRQGTAPGTPSIDSGTPTFSSRRSPRKDPIHRSGAASVPPQAEFAMRSQTRAPGTTESTIVSTSTPQEQTITVKQRHYPPASNTNTPGNNGSSGGSSRSRVLSLFRRSGSQQVQIPAQAQEAQTQASGKVGSVASTRSSEPTGVLTPASAPPTETTFAAAHNHKTNSISSAHNNTGRASPIGMPSRVRRSELDDEGAGLSSSTPPPILRNPRTRGHARRGSEAGGVPTSQREEVVEDVAENDIQVVGDDADDGGGGAVLGPEADTPAAQTTQAAPEMGARKKWLLGRVSGRRRASERV